jgi:hypothetical protein
LQQEAPDAQMKNDLSWAEQHLADGFVAGHSWGEWQSKADFIKDLQNKSNKWKSGNISDVHVASFGSNTAVAHYKFTYDADINGKHRARSVICSDTWVTDSGTWKSVSTIARWLRANKIVSEWFGNMDKMGGLCLSFFCVTTSRHPCA